MHYVLHVLMDADCLIKITQAGYKEHVLDAFTGGRPGARREGRPWSKVLGRAASELIATKHRGATNRGSGGRGGIRGQCSHDRLSGGKLRLHGNGTTDG